MNERSIGFSVKVPHGAGERSEAVFVSERSERSIGFSVKVPHGAGERSEAVS